MPSNPQYIPSVLRTQTNWKELWFYQKTEVLYQLTFVFTHRFFPSFGDRTVDQMVQAARSGKQNIVEGSSDGVTSMEMELKLLNVARSSIKELQEDYEDYIRSHKLTLWTKTHPRFEGMLEYCRTHNKVDDYEPYFEKWKDEEMANTAVTLCRMVDRMMMTYQKLKEEEFLTEGGIRERLTAARVGYRAIQQKTIEEQDREINRLRNEVARFQSIIKDWDSPKSPPKKSH